MIGPHRMLRGLFSAPWRPAVAFIVMLLLCACGLSTTPTAPMASEAPPPTAPMASEAPPPTASLTASEISFTILHTNDTSGHIEPCG
jgi:2',3'-cyclic-nucleotide 2'-phosphodiesterase (5'-nucleotidase family)